jgi:hypothetical protein
LNAKTTPSGISNDAKNKNFDIPGNSGIPISHVNSVELHFKSVCSSFPRIKKFCCHWQPPL